MHRDKVFEVEIGGAAPGGVAAALELPATRMEILDALQMAASKMCGTARSICWRSGKPETTSTIPSAAPASGKTRTSWS